MIVYLQYSYSLARGHECRDVSILQFCMLIDKIALNSSTPAPKAGAADPKPKAGVVDPDPKAGAAAPQPLPTI